MLPVGTVRAVSWSPKEMIDAECKEEYDSALRGSWENSGFWNVYEEPGLSILRDRNETLFCLHCSHLPELSSTMISVSR